MRNRTTATATASVLAILALYITPLGLVSSAVIGLVALRGGIKDAILIVLSGSLAVAGLGFLLFEQPFLLVIIAASLWLPVLVLSVVLRETRSLMFTVQVALVLAGLLLVGEYLLIADMQEFWTKFLNELTEQKLDSQVIPDADRQQLVAQFAPWMSGVLAAAWFMQLSFSIFLARYWQSALYNPGGFAQEFNAFRLNLWVLVLILGLMLAGAMFETGNILSQAALIGISILFLQGLALTHGLFAIFNVHAGWLLFFYVMLIFGLPLSWTAVSAAGFIDGWLDFRARAQARVGKGPQV